MSRGQPFHDLAAMWEKRASRAHSKQQRDYYFQLHRNWKFLAESYDRLDLSKRELAGGLAAERPSLSPGR
jgi:hypothetical protein